MKSFLKFVFLLFVLGAIAGVVASIASKKKLEAMSDAEIREYLALKLSDKVADDQLKTIQDAVVSGVRRGKPSEDHYVEDVGEALADLDHLADDAASEDADEPVQA